MANLDYKTKTLSHFLLFVVSVHLACSDNMEELADGCYILAGEGVHSSADCVAECGDGAQPAEIHSVEQLNAFRTFVAEDDADYVILGKKHSI